MPAKKILFGVMCAVLSVMLIMSGIAVWKVRAIVGGIMNPQLPTEQTSPSETQTETIGETATYDPDHIHEFVKDKTHYATCTEGGYVIYRCQCGETEIRDMTDANGHSYGPGTKVFSCTEDNYTKYVCSECSHVDMQDVVAPTGHKLNIIEPHPATCTEDAYTVRKCSNPDCTYSETEIQAGTAKGGHSFKPWQGTGADKKITCTECNLVVKANELKIITNNKFTSGEQDEYIIEVGTDTVPRLYRYTVQDTRMEKTTVTFRIDLAEGLVVEYDAECEFLGFQDNSLTITTEPISPTEETTAPTESA